MKSKYLNLNTLLSVLSCFAMLTFFAACGDDDDDNGEPLSDAKEILSFVFADLTPAVQGNINGTAITAMVPFGTDVTALEPTVTISQEATVSPASGQAQDFSSPVTYTVTAEDGSEATYTVTVNVTAGSSEKELTTFIFESLDPDVAGVITGNDVAVDVPFGTDVSALAPTITLSDLASVAPASGVEQDFSSPVDYTVTAQDGSTNVYQVTVTILPKPGLAITPVWEKVLRVAGTDALPNWFTINNDADIAVGNGSVYAMNNRDKIRILDPSTGDEKVVDDFLSHTATVTGVYANIVAVKVDAGNNIIGSSGSLPGGNWHVYQWDDESATQEVILTWESVPFRIDNFAVVGDMDGEGYIYAASNDSNQIYRWEVSNGTVSSSTPTITTVSEVDNFGSFTAIFPLSADANSDLLVNGNKIQPILVGADGTVKEELPAAIINEATGVLTGFTSDLVYFELGANKVLVTINTPNPSTQDLVFIDVTNGLPEVTEDDIQRVEFSDNSLDATNINATGGLAFETAGSTVTVYGLITNNGIGAYTVELN